MESWSSRSAWWRVIVVAEVVDPFEVLRAGAADHSVDFVSLAEEELGQVGAVLAGDSGDESNASLLMQDSSVWGLIQAKHAAMDTFS